MLERVVERWLIEANERSLEGPFAQLLASEGHHVIHLSRHGPFEQGKDLLTVSPSGTPCAFQLKAPGNRLTLRQWEGFLPQINRLVEVPIVHPSLDSAAPREVFLVVNGDLDEEVREEISRRNEDWLRRGHPTLGIVVRGQILSRLLALHTPFWPQRLSTERDLLQLYLADGTAPIKKRALSAFLHSVAGDGPLTNAQARRALSNTALLTAYACSPHERASNHVAVHEGWLTYFGFLAALVERLDLSEDIYDQQLALCLDACLHCLDLLAEELATRSSLVEGNALVDTPFYGPRVTWLMALLAARELVLRHLDPAHATEAFIEGSISQTLPRLSLWGEAAIPQFLAIAWFLDSAAHAEGSASIIIRTLATVVAANAGPTAEGLADPYHDIPDVLGHRLGTQGDLEWEAFAHRSFSMKLLVHLAARRNCRPQLSQLWREISQISFTEFTPQTPYDFALPNTERGVTDISFPSTPQSWQQLVAEAVDAGAPVLPRVFHSRPGWLLLYLIAFPHRLTSAVARFLDDQVVSLSRQ